MKIRKSNEIPGYVVAFILILGVFALVAVKLYQLENTMDVEEQDMEQYRKQYLQSEILQSEINSMENNTDLVKTSLESVDIVDIIELQSTFLGISEKISWKSKDIICNEIYNVISNKTILEEENREVQVEGIMESEENHKLQDTNKNDTFQDMDCILKIPSINLEKPVYHQNTKAYLQKFNLVTAYDNMNFSTGGTYIIYGHNSYVENLSFQSLPKVQLTDTIIIEYMNMDYEFLVTDIQRVNTQEISNYFVQEENKIVLVACTNQSTKTNPEYLVITAKK
ncbi:MAG: sortase [Lachnospiraceae bacterium]|nr:sortase [Lachnospiraceae bacterium]